MANILLRGIPKTLHKEIEEIAHSENLSMNQLLLRLISEGLKTKEKREREKEAFYRLNQIREELHEKYGLSEDSTKIIREFRDHRNG